MNWRSGLNIFGAFLLTINVGCHKEASLPEVLVYGHAGTSLYPERWIFPANTRESVEYALDVLDADGVEVDVQMTADGKLVLYHDPKFDEHTDFSGCVASYTYEEIKDLFVYRSSCQLADLDTILDLTLNRKKRIFLDMKPYDFCTLSSQDYLKIDSSLNACLNGFTIAQKESVCVNSRNTELLNQLSDSFIVKSFETDNVVQGIEFWQSGGVQELCLSYTGMNAESVSALDSLGIKFSIFGVKTQSEIQGAIAYGPSRIITDNIAYTKKISQ